MAVTFDAVGPSASGTSNAGTAALSWSHTCGASATAILVGIAVDASQFTGGGDAAFTVTVTYGGVSVPSLQKWESGGSTAGPDGFVQWFGLINPPTGTNTVVVTPGGTLGGVDILSAGSVSFTGAASFGTPVTADPNATAVTSGSVAVTAASSSMVAAVVTDGSDTLAFTAGTSRVLLNGSGAGAAGALGIATIAGAGGTTTISFTQASDYFAAIAVEVVAASAPVYDGGNAAWTRPWQPALAGGFGPRAPFASTGVSLDAAPSVTVNAGVATAAGAATGVSFPNYVAGLAGSGTAGYFTDHKGNPAFLLFEEAWGLPWNSGRWNGGNWQADIDAYFSTRAAQGFKAWAGVAWATPSVDGTLTDGKNEAGTYPFLVNGTAGPITSGTQTITLNNAFWTRLDYLFASALSNGMTCLLNLTVSNYDFGTGVIGAGGTADGVFAHLSTTQAQSFGAQMATRYPQSAYPNVFWTFGDDANSGTWDSYYSAMLTGLQSAGDTRALISCEQWFETSSLIEYDTKAVFQPGGFGVTSCTFSWLYSYRPWYNALEAEYSQTATTGLPAVAGDGIYYGDTDNSTADYTFRRFAWWAIVSGARGLNQTSGTTSAGSPVGGTTVWQWSQGAAAALTSDPNGTWITSHIGNVISYVTSLTDWYKLVPDYGSVFVTAGRGTRATVVAPQFSSQNYSDSDTYVAASITPSGTLAVIYCASAFSITIDQTKMGAGYTATWVDPVSLATTTTTTGSTYSSSGRGNNSAGNPDWVLVLQGPPVTDAPAAAAAAAGAAVRPAVAVTVNAGVAAAAGAAPAAQAAAAKTATAAASAGTAAAPAVAVTVNAGVAAAAGTAPAATVSTVTSTNAPAGVATATAVTVQPSAAVTVTAAVATATGTAPAAVSQAQAAAAVAAAAGLVTAAVPAAAAIPVAAAAAGQAVTVSTAVTVTASAAAAAGAAVQPIVNTSGSTNAPAAVAASSAAAPAPIPAVTVNAAAAAAAGAAPAPQAAAAVTPAAATATGTAVQPSVSTVSSGGATATAAATAGTALQPAVQVKATAGVATAAAAAPPATRPIFAAVAAASSQAAGPSLTVMATAQAATSLATAAAAAGQAVIPAVFGTATATGTTVTTVTAGGTTTTTATAGGQP